MSLIFQYVGFNTHNIIFPMQNWIWWKVFFWWFEYSPDYPIHLMVFILLMKNLDYEGNVFSNIFTAYDNFNSKN